MEIDIEFLFNTLLMYNFLINLTQIMNKIPPVKNVKLLKKSLISLKFW